MSARHRSVIGAVAWRSLHRMYTNPALLLPSLIFPLFFFTAFAGGLSAISNVPGFDFPSGYTAFQFVFVLLQASAFGGVFTGFGIAADFESGFARRMMLAAPNRLGDRRRLLARGARPRADHDGDPLHGRAHRRHADRRGRRRPRRAVLLALLVNLSAGLFACGVATRLRRSRPAR